MRTFDTGNCSGSLRRGVTLIELVILLVILGAIALYARRRFAETPVERAEATLKAVLSEVVDAQQDYFVRHTRYATSVDSLQVRERPGITITVDTASELGYRVTARDVRLPARKCTVWYGAPEMTGGGEGVPVCAGVERPADSTRSSGGRAQTGGRLPRMSRSPAGACGGRGVRGASERSS